MEVLSGTIWYIKYLIYIKAFYMVSESSYLVMGNLVNFEQMHLLRALKKYLENTANSIFNSVQ